MAELHGSQAKRSAPRPAQGTGLETDVRFVKGVGERNARLLARLGIHTVADLLEHYPHRYEDRTSLTRVARLQDGQFAALRLRVSDVESRRAGRRNITITRVAAEDETGTLVLTWFNQPWMRDRFARLRGREIMVYGQARYGRMGLEMNSPDWEPLGSEDEPDPWSCGRFVPLYPLTEGLQQGRMRLIMQNALSSFAHLLADPLPESVLEELDLMDLPSAVRAIHWSESAGENLAARRRLVFDEFFYLQVALAQMRHENGAAVPGIAFRVEPGLLAELQALLPFSLTGAQERVIGQIWEDMQRPHPMNRLVQGDVGSGKTLVALAAMLLAARNGYQSALMAPTEVLAEQHFLSMEPLAERLGLRLDLLSGGPRTRAKEATLAALAAGHLDIVVGTHALIEEGVEFHRLGLVVVDEQHKFGVRQRGALREKGECPDMLVMTATPIPRTLTMTVYGDLDVSIIDEMPPGRKPVKTHCKPMSEAPRVYEGVRQLLQKGGRAYVVCPLVGESEKLQAKAATELAEELARDVFPEYPVGLLHGQMKREEKQAAISDFREGRTRVLVSTTVIEVGVDVPEANVIVVVNAERYGLAQLHQLRGRVGRSDAQSFCVLLADASTDEARRRMEVMESTTDGFRIAEEDLALRGPGEFFGTRQSGMPAFKIADVIRDVGILEVARREAQRIVAADPELTLPEHRAIGKIVAEKYRRRLLETVA